MVLQKLLDHAKDLHFLLFERHVSDFEEEGDGGGDGAEAVGELGRGHEVADEHLDDVRLALVDAGRWDCEELLECDQERLTLGLVRGLGDSQESVEEIVVLCVLYEVFDQAQVLLDKQEIKAREPNILKMWLVGVVGAAHVASEHHHIVFVFERIEQRWINGVQLGANHEHI